MNSRRRAFVAAGTTVALFVLVQVGALALVNPFDSAGFQATQDPTDPTNSALYLGAVLAATAFMLLVFRYDIDWLLRAFVVVSSAVMALYVFLVVIPPVLTVSFGGIVWNVLAYLAGGVLGIALLVYPEWYVIDAAGIVMGAGAAGIFGISFGVLPAVVLLVALAVYDAISVYGTEHMLALADGVMELHLPVLLVVPLSLSYSFLDESEDSDRGNDIEDASPATDGGATSESGDTEGGDRTDTSASGIGDRDALFVGLGDAVMPTVMVASAASFGSAPSLGVPGLSALTLPALTAMAGTILGLCVLLWMVLKGRAHAGLPLLNGGAIGGYLVGALAVGVPLLEALGLGPYL